VVQKKPRDAWLAGFAIALAILLKVYCAFLLPFLLIRRRWLTLAGVTCGLLGLLAVSLIHPGGQKMWQEYIQDVLPRISYHNEGLIQERVDAELIHQVTGDVGEDETIKDGRVYQLYGFNFSSNASLMRVLLDEFFEQDATISRSLLSLLLFLALSLPFIPWLLRTGINRKTDRRQEFLFWLLVMVVILLASPLTWTMNVVWLLPIGVVVISVWRDFGNIKLAIPLILVVAGLVFAALPDHKTLELVDYFEKTWLNHKYVLSEILVLFGGVAYLLLTQSDQDKIQR
ncbi:MAG: glycosyltransferase family 87 protein, partial [Anaerolineaceae bacterium]